MAGKQPTYILPSGDTVEILQSDIDRFLAKIKKAADCWRWGARINANGYGQFFFHRRTVQAHRFAYHAFVETITPDLVLDHLCRVRNCVNPEHLEAVSNRENLMRGDTIYAANAAKDRCPAGHPYTPENTYDRGGRAGRLCKKCDQTRSAKRYAAIKEAPPVRTRPLAAECKNGHPFDEANTYIDPVSKRKCRTCQQARNKRAYEARKAGTK